MVRALSSESLDGSGTLSVICCPTTERSIRRPRGPINRARQKDDVGHQSRADQ